MTSCISANGESLEVGLLAVHQNADTVDAARDPEDDVDRHEHYYDGERDLPYRRGGQRDAQVHHERGTEGDERDDAGEGSAGVIDDGSEGEHAGRQRHGEEQVELLKFLLGVNHSAKSGGDAGVEHEAEDEVDDEEDDLHGAE